MTGRSLHRPNGRPQKRRTRGMQANPWWIERIRFWQPSPSAFSHTRQSRRIALRHSGSFDRVTTLSGWIRGPKKARHRSSAQLQVLGRIKPKQQVD